MLFRMPVDGVCRSVSTGALKPLIFVSWMLYLLTRFGTCSSCKGDDRSLKRET